MTPAQSRLHQALPSCDVSEYHSVDVRAPASAVYQSVLAHRLGDAPIAYLLFGLRGLPVLAASRGRAGWQQQRQTSLFQALYGWGFVRLAEAPGEEIVVGLIGKFWQVVSPPVPLPDAEAFHRFADPSCARAAMNFRVEPLAGGLTRLSTETRVSVPDRASLRLFRLYWVVVGWFSALIRIEMLRSIKRAAEAAQARPASAAR